MLTKTICSGRLEILEQRARPVVDLLRHWLPQQRQRVRNAAATAKAIDNNWGDDAIRPIASERTSWLFAGELPAGE